MKWGKWMSSLSILWIILVPMHISIIALLYSSQNNDSFDISNIDRTNWTERTHKTALKCIRESKSPFGYSDVPIQSKEARKRHYSELTRLMEPFWSVPEHFFAGYRGPWLDSKWRNYFINRSVDDFGPFIPVFTQWEDILFRTKWNNNYTHEANASLMNLRRDFLYVTVSMSDYGIQGNFSKKPLIPPNLLSIAGNGRAHMPIMLTKRPLKYVPLPQPKYLISFVGKTRGARIPIMAFFEKEFGKSFYNNLTNRWISISRQSVVGLSPRGKGRGCFRTTELLELGVIPVIIWDDHPWIPYLNSSLPWNDIAFFTGTSNLTNLPAELRQLNATRIDKMRSSILRYQKSHFSLEGTMHQILLFMKYGYTFSDLRCDTFYKTF